MKNSCENRFDGEKLVIKSAKECHIYNSIILILLFAAGVFVYFKFNSTITTVLVITPPFLLLLRNWIVTGKTIIMRKEHCTVRFLWVSRTYKWNELKTKRIENFSGSIGQRQPYITGVIFSTAYIRNPFRLMPVEYNMFSMSAGGSIYGYFFVFFDPHLENRSIQPPIYEVEEEEFRNLMKEWNVDIAEEKERT